MKHWEEKGILNFDEIRNSVTIRQFHEHVTTKIFGFKHVNEFFNKFQISSHQVKTLQYPTLLMTSKDDPIVRFESLPIDEINLNKNIRLIVTEKGGHLCWFQGIRPVRWYP